VLGDAGRLQQVVGNLLSNAVKFTDARGAVEIVVKSIDEAVQIVVSDTGRGIAPAFLPYVFDRFRQGDVSSARRHGGLGLGLALARDLVHLHGGTIRADSDGEQRGAVFTISLPVLMKRGEPASAPRRAAKTTHDAPPLAGVLAMVVEDDVDSRDLLVTVLKRSGAEVVAVDSCDRAVSRLEGGERRVDVVVSDIGLPTHDGYELIRRIRALPPEFARTPAIAVTAYATQQDRTRVLAAGYRAHLPKPIDSSQLIATLQLVLKEASLS